MMRVILKFDYVIVETTTYSAIGQQEILIVPRDNLSIKKAG